jgi:hypothetical protein
VGRMPVASHPSLRVSAVRPYHRPSDRDRRVVPTDAVFVFGVVAFRALVGEHGSFREHEEPMGEAWWHPELVLFARSECHASPEPKCKRVRTQIDDYVKNIALHRAYGLALGECFLGSRDFSAHPSDGLGLVVLHEERVDPRRRVVARVVGLQEISPLVSKHFGLVCTSPLISISPGISRAVKVNGIVAFLCLTARVLYQTRFSSSQLSFPTQK